MLAQEEDQQLVERVQRGDKRAFDLLVLKYQHKILGLIVRFVHDTHEAQDVAQARKMPSSTMVIMVSRILSRRSALCSATRSRARFTALFSYCQKICVRR